MILERFQVPGLAQYSFVVSDSGSIAVIDPKRDVDTYIEYAKSRGFANCVCSGDSHPPSFGVCSKSIGLSKALRFASTAMPAAKPIRLGLPIARFSKAMSCCSANSSSRSRATVAYLSKSTFRLSIHLRMRRQLPHSPKAPS
jgi:hypothetical protein